MQVIKTVLGFLIALSAFGQSNPNDILWTGKPSGTVGSEVHKNILILNGATSAILSNVTGAGYISEIFIASNKYLTELIVTVDGEATPAIDALIPEFLGDAYLDTQPCFDGWLISGCNNGSGQSGGTFRIPIPFSTSVTVAVKNNSGSTAAVTSYVVYHTGVPDNWTRTQRLRMAVVNGASILSNTETNLVNVTPNKKGRLVGIGWLYDGYPGSVNPRTAPLEGPFKIYIDGSGTAQYQTTGSEDFFGMPWYFQHFNTFGTSSGSATAAPGSTSSLLTILTPNTWGAQRFFIFDPITFDTGLRVSWACGNSSAVNFTGTCTLRATVWYYTEL